MPAAPAAAPAIASAAPGAPAPVQRRISADERRAALIEATLEVVADGGLAAATLRTVADRAGVSNGLIRHHFQGKEAMLIAAYEALIARMVAPGRAALAAPGLTAPARLARFVAASLSAELVQPAMIRQWASFLATIHADPAMADVHRRGYLGQRADIEPLLADARAACGLPPGDTALLATQVNALIDGLWLEGALLPGDFSPDDLTRLGLAGVARLTGVPLDSADP